MEELLKRLLDYGGLGIGLLVAAGIARFYERKLEARDKKEDAWQERWDAREREYRAEQQAWLERHEGKAANFSEHLAQIAKESNETAVKATALGERVTDIVDNMFRKSKRVSPHE